MIINIDYKASFSDEYGSTDKNFHKSVTFTNKEIIENNWTKEEMIQNVIEDIVSEFEYANECSFKKDKEYLMYFSKKCGICLYKFKIDIQEN